MSKDILSSLKNIRKYTVEISFFRSQSTKIVEKDDHRPLGIEGEHRRLVSPDHEEWRHVPGHDLQPGHVEGAAGEALAGDGEGPEQSLV